MLKPSLALVICSIALGLMNPLAAYAGGHSGGHGGGPAGGPIGGPGMHAPTANAPVVVNQASTSPSHVVGLQKPVNAGAKDCHQQGSRAGWHGVTCAW
jgi:hypothetical protein